MKYKVYLFFPFQYEMPSPLSRDGSLKFFIALFRYVLLTRWAVVVVVAGQTVFPSFIEGDERVEPLADGLEHDDTEGNAGEGVDHTHDLPGVSLGRAVAVT